MMYILKAMTRTQLYLPKSQLDALRTLARKEDATVSEITRRLLDIQLRLERNERKTSPRRESLLEAARRIGKLGKPGPKDLSKNVDHYLYGAPKRR